MATIVLCSATGAPGVTATALGLALAWPRKTLLVEADRDGGQALLSGYLAGIESRGAGVVSVVAAQRERRLGSVEQHAIALDESGDRVLIPGFPTAGAAAVCEPLWPDLASALYRLAGADRDVVIDAGRVGTGLPRALLDSADAVLIVLRSSLRSAAAARSVIPLLAEARQAGAVVVGPGQPYGAAEIAAALHLDVWGGVPDDPDNACYFSDGQPRRRIASSPLWRGYRTLADDVAARVAARRDLLRSA